MPAIQQPTCPPTHRQHGPPTPPPPPRQPPVLDPLTPAAAAEQRRLALRSFAAPMLIGMASTSSSTRAKLWACSGVDILLQLLGEEVGRGRAGQGG